MIGLPTAGLSSRTAIEAPGISIFGGGLATSISSSWSFATGERIPEEVGSMAVVKVTGASRIVAGRSMNGSVSRGGQWSDEYFFFLFVLSEIGVARLWSKVRYTLISVGSSFYL
jgi:hypothetical protein